MNLLDLARAALADASPPTRSATIAEAAELRALVGIVAADWSGDERAEGMAAALADPNAALASFRLLAARHRLATVQNRERTGAPAASTAQEQLPADMRACVQCLNLSAGGRCLAAYRGELPGYARSYSPAMTDRPLRCEGYAPGHDDPDRRNGRERWLGILP